MVGFAFCRCVLAAAFFVVTTDAIAIGTCGLFGNPGRMFQVMDYVAKIAYDRGFLKPTSTNFSIELYPVDTKCDGAFASRASLPLFAGVGKREGSFYPGDERDAPPVVAISGCSCSGASGSVAMLGGSFEVPLVSGASTNADLSDKDRYKYFSRVIPTDDMQSLAIAEIIQEYGWEKVYGITVNEKYGMGISEALSKALHNAGVEYVPKIVPNSRIDEFDPSGLVEAISHFLTEQSNRQRVFAVFASETRFTLALLRELDARGFIRPETVVLLPETACDLDLNFTSLAATYAALYPEVAYYRDGYDWGNLFTKLNGVICVMPQSRGPLYTSEEFKSFFTSLTPADFNAAGVPAWIHNDPSWYADFSTLDTKVYYPLIFDGMSSIIHAIGRLKAEGVDTPDIGGELLLNAIRNMTFDGLSGPVGMDAKGDRLAPYSIMNLQGPDLVEVGTYNSAQDTLTMSGSMVFPGGAATAPSSRPVPCAAGEQPSQDGFGCDPCPPGTANKIPGAQACIPCNRGFYSDSGGALQCKMCPAGTEQPREGRTICTACSAGFFGEVRGQPECAPCAPGSFSSAAATKCSQCPVATYADEPAMTACKPCLDTFTTDVPGAEEVGECTCAEGTYWDRLHDVCQKCQPESFCPGGLAPPPIQEGFYGQFDPPESGDAALLAAEEIAKLDGTYAPSPDTAFTKLFIWKCASKLECPRNHRLEELSGWDRIRGVTSTNVGEIRLRGPTDCPPRREGIACAVCEADYFGPTCASCESQPAFAIFIVVLLLLPPFMFLMGQWYRDCDYEVRADGYLLVGAILGLIVFYGQCVGIMSNMSIDWHPSVKPSIDFGRLFLLDVRDAVFMCVTGAHFLTMYWEVFLAPVLLVAAMLVAQGVSRLLPRVRRYDLAIAWECSFNVLGSAFAILHVYIVQNTTAVFECVPNPAAEATLAKFRQVECGSTQHNQATVPMMLGMMLYVVGFFSLCVVLMVVAPRQFANRSFRECVYFLVYRWKPSWWYFSVIYMVRNILVSCTNSMSDDGGTQLVLMGSMLLVATAVMCLANPWKSTILSYVDGVSSVTLLIMILCAQSVHFYVDKIRSLKLEGKADLTVVFEDNVARFSSGMFYCNVALGFGIAVLFVKIANEFRPSIQLEKYELEQLEIQDVCDLFEDMSKHPQFASALNRTVRFAHTDDSVAIRTFIKSVVHRLDDANLIMRASMGGRKQISRKSTVARYTMSNEQMMRHSCIDLTDARGSLRERPRTSMQDEPVNGAPESNKDEGAGVMSRSTEQGSESGESDHVSVSFRSA